VVKGAGETYTEAVPLTESATEADMVETFANADKLPDQSVSADGETPSWYSTIYNENVLFSVGDTEITVE
jgi:hypothetical protein